MGEIQAVYDRSHVINGRLQPAYGHRNVGPGLYPYGKRSIFGRFP